MRIDLRGRIGVVVLCVWSGNAGAQQMSLTLEAALQRAREKAVLVVAARSRIEEARARVRGAKALRDNPAIEGAVGRRSGPSDPDLDFGISQTFELGGGRGARAAGAEARVVRESAGADDAIRQTLQQVSLAFARGLAAAQQVELARATEAQARELQRIADRRAAAGDVAALDVNLAASALSRIRSDVRVAEAERVLAVGELKVLLVLEPEASLALAGDLDTGVSAVEAALLEAASSRPDLKVLQAELVEAEAEVREGRASRWPEATPSFRYERDQGTDILWGGLTLSLPLWNRGQAARGVGEARSTRIRSELEALRRTARTEVRSAFEAHRLRLEALAELQETAARLADNEALVQRSYEVGQIGLAEVLLIRRETTEARAALLKRRLEAAESAIGLMTRAGVLR